MPPYAKFRITVNQDMLANFRALPERARRNLKRRLVVELGPWLQEQVDNLMPQLVPAKAVMPFKFGTEKSKWYYLHVMIPQGMVETDGSNYIRSGLLEHSFSVEVSDRFVESLITVRNIQPAARFVYGPWLVAGFVISGWTAEMEVGRQLLKERAITRVIQIWRECLDDAKFGKG